MSAFLVRGWPRISLKRYRLATVRGMAAGLIDCSLEVRLRGLRSIFNSCRCTIRILGRHVNVRCTALTAFPHLLDRVLDFSSAGTAWIGMLALEVISWRKLSIYPKKCGPPCSRPQRLAA